MIVKTTFEQWRSKKVLLFDRVLSPCYLTTESLNRKPHAIIPRRPHHQLHRKEEPKVKEKNKRKIEYAMSALDRWKLRKQQQQEKEQQLLHQQQQQQQQQEEKDQTYYQQQQQQFQEQQVTVIETLIVEHNNSTSAPPSVQIQSLPDETTAVHSAQQIEQHLQHQQTESQQQSVPAVSSVCVII